MVMIRTKKFIPYNKDLADVLIKYKFTPSGDDFKAIQELGGIRDAIYQKEKTVRAGLPIGAIEEYSKRENVEMIFPNYYGRGIGN